MLSCAKQVADRMDLQIDARTSILGCTAGLAETGLVCLARRISSLVGLEVCEDEWTEALGEGRGGNWLMGDYILCRSMLGHERTALVARWAMDRISIYRCEMRKRSNASLPRRHLASGTLSFYTTTDS